MVSIFIRTYEKDINWLKHCLHSIHKNLMGWDEIVICIPEQQAHLLSHLTNERVVSSALLHFGTSREELFELIRSMGFSVKDIYGQDLNKLHTQFDIICQR